MLSVRKFFCRVVSCPRKILPERIPELLEPSARLTTRLREAVQEIGFATCGKGGERLSPQFGMRVTDTTLLWSLHLVKTPAVGQVRVGGSDDGRWRRGQRYGSILVNLETHTIIDLLPERTAASVIAWVEAHPAVEVVSRDRGGTSVDGAIQVCDRWPLLKNWGEAVQDFLGRAKIRLPEAEAHESASGQREPALPSFSPTPKRSQQTQARLLRKWEIARASFRSDIVRECVSTRLLSSLAWHVIPSVRIGDSPPILAPQNHGHCGQASSIPTQLICYHEGGTAVGTRPCSIVK